MPVRYNGEIVTPAQGRTIEGVSAVTWEIEGLATAELRLTETDQTDPAGRYRWQVTGDTVVLQRAASANWASASTILTLNSATILSFGDDVLLRLGTDGDGVFILRSTALAANTALTNVIVGTADHGGFAANSVLISNITAGGDIALLVNNGGNSLEAAKVDTSVPAVIFNDGQVSNFDTIFRGATNANLVSIDTSTDRVGILVAAPRSTLANTATNITDGDVLGVALLGITWLASDIGYVCGINNTSAGSDGQGLLVRITGTAAANQVLTANVAGTDRFTILGNGVAVFGDTDSINTARATGTLRTADVTTTGGAGNVAGADIIIAPGLGTGTGNVGRVVFSLPIEVAAGNTIQTRAERMALDMVSSSTVLLISFAQAVTIQPAVASNLTLDTQTTGALIIQAASLERFRANDTGIGFFAVAPVARATAYTQTFATANKTMAQTVGAAVAVTAATQTSPFGYTTAAQADDIVARINQLRTDLDDTQQMLNAVIDDFQSYGLLQ